MHKTSPSTENSAGLGGSEEFAATESRIRAAQRSSRGVRWIVIGAVLGFLSCVNGLCNPVPGIYEFVLYGLTSVAILLILWGLYLIFE